MKSNTSVCSNKMLTESSTNLNENMDSEARVIHFFFTMLLIDDVTSDRQWVWLRIAKRYIKTLVWHRCCRATANDRWRRCDPPPPSVSAFVCRMQQWIVQYNHITTLTPFRFLSNEVVRTQKYWCRMCDPPSVSGSGTKLISIHWQTQFKGVQSRRLRAAIDDVYAVFCRTALKMFMNSQCWHAITRLTFSVFALIRYHMHGSWVTGVTRVSWHQTHGIRQGERRWLRNAVLIK